MKTARRLSAFLHHVKSLVAFSIGLGMATTISWIALVSTSAWLISFAALQPSIAELQVAIVGVRFFGIARGVFRYLERLVSHTVTFRLLARLRTWLYERIEPLAPAGLIDDSSGDLLSAMVDDIEALEEFYIRVVAPPVVALVSSLFFLAFIGQWSFWFSVVLLGFQVVTGLLIPLIARQMGREPGEAIIHTRAAYGGLAVEAVQGSADILLYGLGSEYQERMDGLIADEVNAEMRQNRIFGMHSGITAFLVNASLLCLLVLAIPLVSSGILDGRLLAVIVLGALASFESILPLGEVFQRLEESLGAGERIFRLVDREPPRVGDRPVIGQEIDIKFRNIDFAYRHDSELVLRNFSLNLASGKKVAVIGPSGVGKSTLINLLLCFWHAQAGEILINEQDIRQFDPESMRSQFAYLPQNPFLFNTTIAENIRIGNPKAGMEQVAQAAHLAGLTEFIQGIPAQFETMVGEFGVMLSGGQRQRLALARAFIRDAPVLILDEPTANLDLRTSQAILKTALSGLRGKSLLLISHDLWGMEMMDEILVLEGGRVIEQGLHAELIQMDGRYAMIFAQQQDFLFD